MHFNDLFDLVDESLPGKRLWMQCVPVHENDQPTEEGVGLAIQKVIRERPYLVVYFSVVPDSSATTQDGEFLPDSGAEASDWTIEIGYQGDFYSLEEAINEAKILARGLPMSPIWRTEARRNAILDAVSDPDLDDEDDHDDKDPDSQPDPRGGPQPHSRSTNRIVRQKLITPAPDEKDDHPPRRL